ncbi:MAG TPA: radical SAM protein [Vicinamibacterales bacterium]|nr:radical SAM protein [Vicinamibacterales bacterium]
MRVCLALQHVDDLFTPLQLTCLKAALVDLGGWAEADVPIVEFSARATVDAMVERLLALDADVLALSCYVWNVTALFAVGRRVKAARPNVRVVLGGPEVGPLAETVVREQPWVDVVVKNEGEMPMVELADRWRRGAPIDDVPGIVARSGDRVVDTGPERFVRNLGDLPSPHRDFVSYAGKYACVETQRGCVYECNFCFFNKDLPIRNRRLEVDRVDREIKYLLDQDIRCLYFMDPIFNLNVKRAKEICRLIVEHNHRGVVCHAELWAEFMDEELAALMKAAHFEFVEVGLQSTNPTALAAVDRRLRMAPFLLGVDHLTRAGIEYELHLIFGLPGDTLDTFRRSLDFAATLNPPTLSVFDLRVLPGTDLWTKSDEFGITFDREPPHRVIATPTFTSADVEYGRRMARSAESLWRSRAVRVLRKEPAARLSAIAEGWMRWSDAHGGDVEDLTMLPEYLSEFCGSRDIPPGFYAGMASVELQRPAFARADAAAQG